MLFLTGHHGSGKTTCAEALRPYGFISVDLGPMIRDLHRRAGTTLSIGEWCQFGEAKEGPDFTNRVLVLEMKRTLASHRHGRDIVVVGNRSKRGIGYLSGYCNKRPVVIYIDSDPETLRQNFNRRDQLDLSEAQFQKLLARERATGLDEIKDAADHVVYNDSDVATLLKRIHTLISERLGYTYL